MRSFGWGASTGATSRDLSAEGNETSQTSLRTEVQPLLGKEASPPTAFQAPESHRSGPSMPPNEPVAEELVQLLTVDEIAEMLLKAELPKLRRVLRKLQLQRPELFDAAAMAQVEKEVKAEEKEEKNMENGQRQALLAKKGIKLTAQGVTVMADLLEPDDSHQEELRRDDEEADILQKQSMLTQLDDAPLVQFNAPLHFALEGEDVVAISVIRLGRLDKPSAVRFETSDASAVAGLKYEAAEGILEFRINQTAAQIKIRISQDDRWDPDLDFKVHLLPEGLVGARLDKYLSMTRIKIIDDDCFPTNTHRECLDSGEIEGLVPITLYKEYLRGCAQNPALRKNFMKFLMAQQVSNFCSFAKMLAHTFLLDVILSPNPPENWKFGMGQHQLLMCLVWISMLVFAGLHFLNYLKLTWGLPGMATRNLQVALVRKFFSYNEISMHSMERGRLINSLTLNCPAIVEHGLMSVLELSQALGLFINILLYNIVGPMMFNTQCRLMPLLSLMVLPLILVIAFRLRFPLTKRHLTEVYGAQVVAMEQVTEAIRNFHLVSDYKKRGSVSDEFMSLLVAVGLKNKGLKLVLMNNSYIAPWVLLLYLVLYVVHEGAHVMDGDLTVGIFMVDIHNFITLGATVGMVFQLLENIGIILPLLKELARFLNMDTDTLNRYELAKHQQEFTTKQWKKAMAPAGSKSVAAADDHDHALETFDALPITMQNISLGFGLASVTITQGQLVSLIGPTGGGKSVLLMLLGGAKLPMRSNGEGGEPMSIFNVPSHLRVLHVPAEPLFFKGTLLQNLTYGVMPGDEDGDIGRIKAILGKLGVKQHVIDMIANEKSLDWGVVLSPTTRNLLSLARALVANPELICAHKPTELLDQENAKQVLRTLRSFVRKRGVEQDPATFGNRRPRTCIFTSSKKYGVEISDKVFKVLRTGVEEVSKTEVTSSMLN
mmetsp:Transcript_174168/g.552895  ORF Transcript_174168/g.552895 Transcript_174168/m.552895 type:complete len:942 (-) Transcript_174168:79-2904(-)